MRGASHWESLKRFISIRDHFYKDPDAVRHIAQSMKYREYSDLTGHMTEQGYHERGMQRRLEEIIGIRITRWDDNPCNFNGIFYESFSTGPHREVPAVHYDTPCTDITVLVYLTPNLPSDCGTSFWQHKKTKIISEPDRSDALRLKSTLAGLRNRLERDSQKRERWLETDRVGYKYNRMVAFTSGMLHSASRHYGSNLQNGRLFQAFRIGVDWSSCRLYR
jgi:Family of unknown function (DUF6445)